MNESRVLVAGATGQLGRVITRKLIASGSKVRALARNREALAQFGPDAEIAAVDLRDLAKLTDACRGVDQIVATANNNMGHGETSPRKIDCADAAVIARHRARWHARKGAPKASRARVPGAVGF